MHPTDPKFLFFGQLDNDSVEAGSTESDHGMEEVEVHFEESAWSIPMVLGLVDAGKFDTVYAVVLLFVNCGMQIMFSGSRNLGCCPSLLAESDGFLSRTNGFCQSIHPTKMEEQWGRKTKQDGGPGRRRV